MLILASKSPRRQALLQAIGANFTVVTPEAPESPWDGALPPADYARQVAIAKALEVSARLPEALVLSADTVVSLGGQLFGKPADLDAARAMLAALSGQTHQVFTGVAFARQNAVIHAFTAGTEVRFRQLDDSTISAYMSLVNTLDKAGAYGIQEHGGMIVERIAGSFSNVVGLPVEAILDTKLLEPYIQHEH